MVLSIFTEQCNYQHNKFRGILTAPKETPCPLIITSDVILTFPANLLILRQAANLVSDSIDLPILDISDT